MARNGVLKKRIRKRNKRAQKARTTGVCKTGRKRSKTPHKKISKLPRVRMRIRDEKGKVHEVVRKVNPDGTVNIGIGIVPLKEVGLWVKRFGGELLSLELA